ncbi:MAG: discoidin domain-containing protein, partial [Armatimonadetes bacterium]|nr:discoidin domain-containing protein [Armatimonadota bacterium]
WIKPAWPAGTREVFTVFHIKLRGGTWNGLWLGHHGTIGPDIEALGSNVMDGVDHPAYLAPCRHLAWRAGEWHHIAFTWTDYTSWVFWDGRLIAQFISQVPFLIGQNEGEVCLASGWRSDVPARVLVDEFRLSDVPLYCPDHPPDPLRRPAGELDLGLATPAKGARAIADSTAQRETRDVDVVELHDGAYGKAAQIGTYNGQGMVLVKLAEEAEVAGFEWSRDGVPYAGPQGRGWARVLPYPREFSVETSLDGERWEKAVEETDFRITPAFVAQHHALRFRHDFQPRRARFVRMTVRRGPRGEWGIVLDEVAVYAPDGRNLALQPGVCVSTTITSRARRYDPELAIDGRWGEESCWRSATPGRGVITVELPEPTTVSGVVFSRSHEGLVTDRVPSAGRIEVSFDGQTWSPVAELSGADAKPRHISFEPHVAKFVRLNITATSDGGEPTIDDLRIY